MSMRKFVLNAVLTAGLAGCATMVSEMPKQEAPSQWRNAPMVEATPVDRAWWRNFGSDELSSLIDRVQSQSLDLATAEARIRQAEATARMIGAELWPNVVGGLEAGRSGFLDDQGLSGNSFGARLSASYEIDLWGRLRSNRNAAQSGWQASTFDRDAVLLSVTAAVASNWLQAIALQERIAIGERNLATAKRLLALVEARARAGAATPLEVARQRGLVAAQRRVLASIRQQADDARTALAVLLGQASAPEAGRVQLAALTLPAIGLGLPSELLTRRPDIARTEAQLQSADASVQAARAALFPSLSLGADLGSRGDSVRRIFENPVYSLAAALTAPIFNAGKLAARRDLAEARREELLADYRQSIVAAFGEVESALNATVELDEQIVAQTEELAQAQRAMALAENRYRAGAETPLMLLDTQRTLYAAQDVAVQLKLARLQAAVSLYKALGGGWTECCQG